MPSKPAAMPAPIILFAYNRPAHTEATLQALAACELAAESELHIFVDYPKKPEHQATWEATKAVVYRDWPFRQVHITERQENYGLIRSVIEGVSALMEQHGRAIVLEDDLQAAPSFLRFMNEALDAYEDQPEIFSVSGYNFGPNLMQIPDHYQDDYYFCYRPTSWGWATWRDRWATVDWEVKDIEQFKKSGRQQRAFNRSGDDLSDMLIGSVEGRLHSWYARFAYAQFKQQRLSIVPVRSLIQNIGMDGSGVHCGPSDTYWVDLETEPRAIRLPARIYTDKAMLKAVFRANRQSWKHKLKLRLAKAGLVKW